MKQKNNTKNTPFTVDTDLHNKMYRLVLRLVKNIDEAEDIIQEVLIKIWKNSERIEAIENKDAYCMRMAKNQALDSFRKKKIKSDDIDNYYHLKDSKKDPEQAYVGNEKMQLLLDLINKLPIKQKTVMQLRDIEGYSYKEISEISGLKVDQVKVNLHRARITLRKAILDRGLRNKD